MNFAAIQRIDIAGDDSLEKSELLGFHDESYDNVILFNEFIIKKIDFFI